MLLVSAEAQPLRLHTPRLPLFVLISSYDLCVVLTVGVCAG